jgi:hypothetical protein
VTGSCRWNTNGHAAQNSEVDRNDERIDAPTGGFADRRGSNGHSDAKSVGQAGRRIGRGAGACAGISAVDDNVGAHDHANNHYLSNDPHTLSDIRLKRDVVRVGRLANGVPLYRFRYLWSNIVYVGVIAQEMLPAVPEAVLVDENGFMQVNYDRLGMRMMTWEDWEHRSMVCAAT